MVMKINGGKPPEKTDVIRPRKAGKSDQAGAGREAVADTVKVSETAREIAEIAAAVKSLPDARPDLVGEIKKQIDSGNYAIDAHKIAGKMLNETI